MDRRLVEDIDRTLAQAVQNLLNSQTQQNNWGDVRSTALAVVALNRVINARHAPAEHVDRLKRAATGGARWLAGQVRTEEGGMSFESEAWDTSLAMLALITAGNYGEIVDGAAAWLKEIHCGTSGVWYDEIWETTLTTIALLRQQTARKGPRQHNDDLIIGVMRWLNDIPSKPSGEYVNPHYSAFLVWLDAEIIPAVKATTLETDVYRTFQAKAAASAEWLVKRLSDVRDEDLWCLYTFSNAYIAFALAIHPKLGRTDNAFLSQVIDWFATKQGTEGGFEDIEDTSLAVLALTAVRDSTDSSTATLERALSRARVETSRDTVQCFLGYAAHAHDVALHIKDYLNNAMSRIKVEDWNWDFRFGGLLPEEIAKRARTCQTAVFLVTRDDLVSVSDQSRRSPRDNVVFEIGVFFGAIGRERTILIVEEGTELPSDWSGLIHISLKNRADPSSVYAHLRRALENAVGLI